MRVCPSCGQRPSVDRDPYGVTIVCWTCYDGAPDAGPQCLGWGRSLSKAVEAWNHEALEALEERSEALEEPPGKSP